MPKKRFKGTITVPVEFVISIEDTPQARGKLASLLKEALSKVAVSHYDNPDKRNDDDATYHYAEARPKVVEIRKAITQTAVKTIKQRSGEKL